MNEYEKMHFDVVQKIQRPRVLLLAYACSPYWGSEQGVGWFRACETAKYFDCWVIVKKDHEEDIEKYFSEQGRVPRLNFCFVSRTRPQRLLMRIPGLFYIAYNLWHRRAYRVALQLHKTFCFDLVHQVNFATFREPGYLWKMDIPFVWGLVGGTQNYPWRFLGAAGTIGVIKESIRTAVNMFQLRFSRRVRNAARKAVIVLVANSTARRDFERYVAVKPRLLLETGIDYVPAKEILRKNHARPLRIIWVGFLERHKALHLLLMALKTCPIQFRTNLELLAGGR